VRFVVKVEESLLAMGIELRASLRAESLSKSSALASLRVPYDVTVTLLTEQRLQHCLASMWEVGVRI
jgi:hypothetical protein